MRSSLQLYNRKQSRKRVNPAAVILQEKSYFRKISELRPRHLHVSDCHLFWRHTSPPPFDFRKKTTAAVV
jgi:hypothetical protein